MVVSLASLDDQIRAMGRIYPKIALQNRIDRTAEWFGPLTPYRKTYFVRIRYRWPYAPEKLSLRVVQPLVQILNPILLPQDGVEESPLPHVYPNKRCSLIPYLCLFDPDAFEWSTADLIADTTVPWTERWLLNYEFWRATGCWAGGGRHDRVQALPEAA